MLQQFRDYFWKEGLPIGIDALGDNFSSQESYKIVMDPYRKRVSIEKYIFGEYKASVYDSYLLNFRHLNQTEQQCWQKLPRKNSGSPEWIIRDQDDRVIFIETYQFQQHLCVECIARSPQGVLLTFQKMHYKIFGDSENSVILYDSNQHPVLKKIYEADPLTGEFLTLVNEIRDMKEVDHAKNKIC